MCVENVEKLSPSHLTWSHTVVNTRALNLLPAQDADELSREKWTCEDMQRLSMVLHLVPLRWLLCHPTAPSGPRTSMTPLSPSSVSSNSGSLSPAQALPPSTLHPNSHLRVSGSHGSGLVVPKPQLGSNHSTPIHENRESILHSAEKGEASLTDDKGTAITPSSPELNRGH